METEALLLSLRLAATTTVILFVIALPVAHWLAFTERPWKFIVDAIVAMPLVLPPTVLGFYLLVALGPRSPLGRFWESLTGAPLVFNFTGLVIASVLFSLPFVVQPFTAGFQSVDRSLIEASWTLGVSKLSTFFRVVIPLSSASIVTGLVLGFTHTLGEFGVVLMVGGNIPGVTRTASIAIYDDVQALDYGRAGNTAALLLGISFVVIVITYAIRAKKGSAAWRVKS